MPPQQQQTKATPPLWRPPAYSDPPPLSTQDDDGDSSDEEDDDDNGRPRPTRQCTNRHDKQRVALHHFPLANISRYAFNAVISNTLFSEASGVYKPRSLQNVALTFIPPLTSKRWRTGWYTR